MTSVAIGVNTCCGLPRTDHREGCSRYRRRQAELGQTTLAKTRAYREKYGLQIFQPPKPLSSCWYCGEPADAGSLGDELVLHPSCNGGRGVYPGSEHGRSLARLYRAREAEGARMRTLVPPHAARRGEKTKVGV